MFVFLSRRETAKKRSPASGMSIFSRFATPSGDPQIFFEMACKDICSLAQFYCVLKTNSISNDTLQARNDAAIAGDDLLDHLSGTLPGCVHLGESGISLLSLRQQLHDLFGRIGYFKQWPPHPGYPFIEYPNLLAAAHEPSASSN